MIGGSYYAIQVCCGGAFDMQDVLPQLQLQTNTDCLTAGEAVSPRGNFRRVYAISEDAACCSFIESNAK